MSASLIRDLGCEGMTYGPKWKDPAFVMECLCKYITEEGHRGLIGKTVAAAAFALAYDHPHSGTGEEHQAIARLIELGQGSAVIREKEAVIP